MALAVGVMVAAQTLEQAIELLQPGTGGRAIVRLGQARQFRQRGHTHRVQRLFDRGDRLFAGKQVPQLP
ncbi:hypothetical protein D3C76_1325820 [compost metagenome]